jgi:hypothetical protein
MSDVRKLQIKSKISQVVLDGTGIRAGDAIAEAEDNVAFLTDSHLIYIDEYLEQITSGFGREGRKDTCSLEPLYLLCTRILDVAGALPESGLTEATRSLCDLIDLTSNRNPDWPSVDVHLDAMRLLRTHGTSFNAAQRASVLVGLSDVNRRFRKTAAA